MLADAEVARMIDSIAFFAILAAGLLLAFRGVSLRTCPAGPRRARGYLAVGMVLAAGGLMGVVFLHGPWGPGERHRHGMGEHRMGPGHRMMEGAPEGVDPATLPDADDAGAKLFVRYCTACHGAPNPRAHTAADWPAVVARMRGHMGTFNKPAPGDDEVTRIVAYLSEHAAGE